MEKRYRRQNMRHLLAIAWLKTHRMDVYEAIQNEVNKKFPIKRKQQNTVLPDSLVRMR